MLQSKVEIGITTVIGWLVFVAGIIPIIVKLLEEGLVAYKIGGAEKWSAIVALVSLAITQIGRYAQAHALITHPPQEPQVEPVPEPENVVTPPVAVEPPPGQSAGKA